MNNFYVYLHRKKTNGEVFYVGKGKNNRAWSTNNRNQYWKNTFNKHGLVVEVVFDNLTEDEALTVEIDTILEFKYFGASLCNLTNGGEGTSGYKFSDQSKKLMSAKRKGRVKSEIERENLSKSQKGRVFTESHKENMSKAQIGKKQSEETKLKKSLKLKEVGTCNDRFNYVFYSDNDIFIGTRIELSQYTGIPNRKFRTLFSKQRSLVSNGWSVLRFYELINIKENISCQ